MQGVVSEQLTKGTCMAEYITWQPEVMGQLSNQGVPATMWYVLLPLWWYS